MDADALYALAPELFTAARDEAAKAAKAAGHPEAAKALKALRRPSVAAWLVNRLTAGQPELLQELLSLGPALAEAQAGGDAAGLRALGAQRKMLVQAVSDAAAQDRTVSAAVRAEVATTLEAALADPASAEAVRSGRLVRALSYAGFGTVDLTGAVAEVHGQSLATAQAAGSAKAAPNGRRAAQATARAVAAAERCAHEAAGGLDDAVRAYERAERRRADAAAARADADVVVAHARSALSAAEQDQSAAAAARQEAESDVTAAQSAVSAAQDAAEQARTALDALRRP